MGFEITNRDEDLTNVTAGDLKKFQNKYEP